MTAFDALRTDIQAREDGHPALHNRAHELLKTLNVRHRNVQFVDEYGAVNDGVTDSTAVIQSAIDACPSYGAVWFGGGAYVFTHLVNNHPYPVYLAGVGAMGINGSQITYGHAQWLTLPKDWSTTLLCSAVDGVGLDTGEAGYGFQLDRLILRGVGDASRTTTGIRVGSDVLGGRALRWRDVTVANFKTGVHLYKTYEGFLSGLALIGCETGTTIENSNALGIVHLDVSRCNVGVTIRSSGQIHIYGNTCQGVWDAGFVLDYARYCDLSNIYFESPDGNYDLKLAGGSFKNRFVNLYHGTDAGRVLEEAECYDNLFQGGQLGHYDLRGKRTDVQRVHANSIVHAGSSYCHAILREGDIAGHQGVEVHEFSPNADDPTIHSGLAVRGGDVLLEDTAGLLMQSRNGTWWHVSVADDGTLSAALVETASIK